MRPKNSNLVRVPKLSAQSAVAVLAESGVIDLSTTTTFCKLQAENASLFTDGVESPRPGILQLKSPFRENYIASLAVYNLPNAGFRDEDKIAYFLPRHVEWYCHVRDIDRIRGRFAGAGSKLLRPTALHGALRWWEGFIGADGTFAIHPEYPGTPAVLAFQEFADDYTSLAFEIRGQNLKTDIRQTLKSALKELLLQLRLEQRTRGRPSKMPLAEKIAHARDYRGLSKLKIAQELCDCGRERHDRRCFDRLNKLADNFYSNQKKRIEELVAKSSSE